MSDQKWQRSSLRQLKKEMNQYGYEISHTSIRRLLKKMKYSLKANVKRVAGTKHPDRNQQFEYLDSYKKAFMAVGHPIISVDTKKKEMIGNFKNTGRTWCHEAAAVNDHDFDEYALGKAIPYGIYDVARNHGYVYVGKSADTPQFAVDMISLWWETAGCFLYPETTELLILADAGGSNGYRLHLWKQQIQEQLADRLGLHVTVCHYPTGTSKWNPIEHRLFGPISINWAGKPLRSFESMLDYIRGTATDTGLCVDAALIEKVYQKGIKVDDDLFRSINIQPHSTCPRWNYTIRPQMACA